MNKKLILLALSSSLLLAACSKVDYSQLKIVTPVGAPAVALYGEVENPNFETNADASNIIASMSTGQYDVVVLPTDTGIKSINKGLDYKLAATITFGNLFIASTGNDDNETMDPTDKIVLFQQGAFPDKIFHYVYGDQFDSAIFYASNAQEAAKCLSTGINMASENEKVDYVLMAEPALTTVLGNTSAPTYGKATVYANLQEEYEEKSGGAPIFQASIFVKGTSDKKAVDEFLKKTKQNVQDAISNPEKVSEALSKKEDPAGFFGVGPQVAENVLNNNNGLGIGFKYAYENKASIDTFVALFGIEGTNEEIYYK